MSAQRRRQPTFVLTLQPIPGTDGVRAMRWVLKTLLRKHGLRCVSIEQTTAPDNQRSGDEQPRAAASAQNGSNDQ
jgi:hypothetical protein